MCDPADQLMHHISDGFLRQPRLDPAVFGYESRAGETAGFKNALRILRSIIIGMTSSRSSRHATSQVDRPGRSRSPRAAAARIRSRSLTHVWGNAAGALSSTSSGVGRMTVADADLEHGVGDGTTTQIANLSAFIKANPVANPDEEDFEPDGTWYSMVGVRGNLLRRRAEPRRGRPRRSSDGRGPPCRRRLREPGPHRPDRARLQGNFFLGNLGTFPVVPGTQTVFKLTPSGQLNRPTCLSVP